VANKRKNGLANQNGDAVFDEFLSEIESEIRIDKYKALWDRFGKILTIALTALLVVAALFLLWQRYDFSQREEISAQFIKAQELIDQNKAQEAITIMKFIEGRKQKNYAALAKLSRAALLAETDFKAHAKEIALIYKELFESSIPGYMKELCVVLYANTILQTILAEPQADSDSKTEAGAVLTPAAREAKLRDLIIMLDANVKSDGGFRLMAYELKGVILFKLGEMKQARAEFDKISKDEKAPAGMRSRVSIMIQAIQDIGGDASTSLPQPATNASGGIAHTTPPGK
jgi:hypothetical protein